MVPRGQSVDFRSTDFLKRLDGEEVVVGAGEVRRGHEGQAADLALHGEFAIFRDAYGAKVSGLAVVGLVIRLVQMTGGRKGGNSKMKLLTTP